MNEPTIAGLRVPRFLYGTAWKEEQTQRLTELAIRQGFRGIDTANQRRHYDEEAVGKGIAAAVAAGVVERKDLFLQTKFTFRDGQDHRLPFDPRAPIAEQVLQSFASSQKHLGTEIIDSLVLHGPTRRHGLSADDWAAWRSMEAIHASGRARLLGISNVGLDQLELLCAEAKTPPQFVQNRCFAALGWDREVRSFCARRGIVYQGFSLLTANREAVFHPDMAAIARHHGRTICQAIFRFALDVGMLPLTGTTSADHMKEDLEALSFGLEPDEIDRIEHIARR